MTDQEMLERATRALRDLSERGNDGAEESFARLRWSKPLGRSVLRQLVVPLIAAATVFGGAVAWAGNSGQLQRWITKITEQESTSQVTERKPSKGRGIAPRASRPVPGASNDEWHDDALPSEGLAVPTLAVPTLAVPASTVQVPSSAKPPSRPRRSAAQRRPATTAPPAPNPGKGDVARERDADAEFKQAHRLHFGARDYAGALKSWIRYLATAPVGDRWLPEARFNRAVALVRLGRYSEARAALLPFSRGVYGGYRRAEASKLLEQMNDQ